MGTTEALLDGWEDTTPSADTLTLAAVRAMADRATLWASAAGGRVRTEAGLVLADACSPCPFLNVATATRPLDADTAAAVAEFFGGAGYVCLRIDLPFRQQGRSPHPSFAATDREGLREACAAIRKVGAEFCILSSDLGQKGNPLPADGFAAFILALKARGFSDQDLDRMSKQNPAKLLGLP